MESTQISEITIRKLSHRLGPEIIKTCNAFKKDVLKAEKAKPRETDTAVLHALTSAMMSVAIDVISPEQRETWIKYMENMIRNRFNETEESKQ